MSDGSDDNVVFNEESLKKYLFKGSKLVCEEKNKKVRLETNEATFYRIKIDGGVEPENCEPKRCDYLILKKEKDICIYVELKGVNIDTAYKQIEATYKKHNNKNRKAKHYACIAHSAHPSCNTSIQNIKENFKNLLQIKAYLNKDIVEMSYIAGNDPIKKTN